MTRSFPLALSVLFAASVVLAADPTPEEVYKKIADAWSAAKTIHIEGVKTSITEPSGLNPVIETSMWIEEGNHINVVSKKTFGTGTRQMIVERRRICDGTTVVTLDGGKEAGRNQASKDLGSDFRSAVLAGGVMVAGTMFEKDEVFKFLGTSDFKPLAEAKVNDHAATVLQYTYKCQVGSDAVALSVKLYVDKATLQVLKREASDPTQGKSLTEEYPLIETGAKVPADTFKLPAPPSGGNK